MHRSRAFFRESDECRSCDEKCEYNYLEDRHPVTFTGCQAVSSLERVSVLEEEDSAEDTDNESDESENCVQVSAGQSQDHSERTAEEHKTAYHREESKYESCHRSASALGAELLLSECSYESSDNDSDDLRSDILNRRCLVKSKSACRVTQEACDAESHVLWVSEERKARGDDTDNETGDDDKQLIIFLFHIDPPYNPY